MRHGPDPGLDGHTQSHGKAHWWDGHDVLLNRRLIVSETGSAAFAQSATSDSTIRLEAIIAEDEKPDNSDGTAILTAVAEDKSSRCHKS